MQGQNLGVKFLEYHRNEKLRKTHQLPEWEGGLPVPRGFDTSKLPYVRDSVNGGKLASLQAVGASVLVVPKPGAGLVRPVSQKNSLVHFIVPKTRQFRGRENRFAGSTLEIPAFHKDRLAPEYVNIRHQIDPTKPATQKPKDLNVLDAKAFADAMSKGGYAAAHFMDDSCDGCVEAVVKGLAREVDNLPGFSLITAPDFFPLADQFEVETDPNIRQVEPLSKGRLPVNPTLPRPSDLSSKAFDQRDKTVTAIVGGSAIGAQTPILGRHNRMVSFLPDAASNVFAPGWDTSRSRDALGAFLTSSGLGSPFPEDAKLCAALASYWPAVAPDNGRTFGNQGSFKNQLPMLDEELGFHPKHEQVQAGEVRSYTGWDGEFGPFFESVGRKSYVNFVDIERSDYVSHALAGRIRVSLTAEVQSEDLIARNQALEASERTLGKQPGQVCLVVFRKIDKWADFSSRHPDLVGGGFLLEFAELTGNKKPTTDVVRVRKEVKKRHICQVGSNGIAYKNGAKKLKFNSF